MTIYTPKSTTESDFYKVAELINRSPWLKDTHYEKGLHGLLEEYKSEEERQALTVLFERFIHHESRDRLEAVDYLVEVIRDNKFTHQDTLFVATSDGKESDGSTAGLYHFKPVLAELGQHWKEDNLVPSLNMSFERCTSYHIKNVVIFDDFIGSGKTIVNKVIDFRKEMKSRRISHIKVYVFSYVGMKFGVEYANQKLGINIYCPLLLRKGISDYIDANPQNLLQTIQSMEKNLNNKWNKLKIRDFQLGYKQSEALYQLYRSNCSNNVFPIFWWGKDASGKHRVTLFNRL